MFVSSVPTDLLTIYCHECSRCLYPPPAELGTGFDCLPPALLAFTTGACLHWRPYWAHTLLEMVGSRWLVYSSCACILTLLCISNGAQSAPANANFSSCRVHPDWGNCCTPGLEAILKYPPQNVMTLTEYLRKNPLSKQKRFRPAAHLADDAYIEKYNRAMLLLKALPPTDPRSHSQQGFLHCLYGSPDVRAQLGYPDLDYQVHKTWLFMPFHRWFSFFHERILAKLLGDETFALPFWNWDSQAATTPYPNSFPLKMYGQPLKYPGLYDANRNKAHCSTDQVLIDLSMRNVVNDVPSAGTDNGLRDSNNELLWSILVKNHTDSNWVEVYSPPLRAGGAKSKMSGDLEANPHAAIHMWTGSRENKQWEDMGRGYSAARDPIFFAHHNNVDRMWDIWLKLPGKGHYTDPDYLDAEFLFYDENGELVKVTVAQALDMEPFMYEYQKVDDTWLNYRRRPRGELRQVVDDTDSAADAASGDSLDSKLSNFC